MEILGLFYSESIDLLWIGEILVFDAEIDLWLNLG